MVTQHCIRYMLHCKQGWQMVQVGLIRDVYRLLVEAQSISGPFLKWVRQAQPALDAYPIYITCSCKRRRTKKRRSPLFTPPALLFFGSAAHGGPSAPPPAGPFASTPGWAPCPLPLLWLHSWHALRCRLLLLFFVRWWLPPLCSVFTLGRWLKIKKLELRLRRGLKRKRIKKERLRVGLGL